MGIIRHAGFTLLELLIALIIVGMLLIFAIPVYIDYTERAKVSTGIYLAAAAKQAVSEHHVVFNEFPDNNSNAGITSPEEIASQYVQSVGITQIPAPGTILITYKGSSRIDEGATVLLVPTDNIGSIAWNCISTLQSLLPPSCR